jgi:hypothetical protein
LIGKMGHSDDQSSLGLSSVNYYFSLTTIKNPFFL